MKIGVGLDPTLGLSLPEEDSLQKRQQLLATKAYGLLKERVKTLTRFAWRGGWQQNRLWMAE